MSAAARRGSWTVDGAVMAISRTFHFSTVVWGPWHTGVYLDVNLPSLLAAANLEAFAGRHKVIYRIFTSEADLARIEASPAYQRAKAIVSVELIGQSIDGSIDPIAMHHILWRRSIDDARNAGAMILLIPPDVVWSSGSFGHIAERAAEGKKAIFMTYMRVVSETAVPEVERLFLDPSRSVIEAPARDLVALGMRNIHPLTLTYARDSDNFPIHPEFILWPVGGEGYLMRVLVREMFAYDPRCFDLNGHALMAHRPAPDDVHYITDSDDLFSLSLAPLMKDIEWYAKPRRLCALDVGAWWLRYDSPANDMVASRCFYIHGGDRTRAKWRKAELQSDVLIKRLIGTREILHLISMLAQCNLTWAEQVLALALGETKLARLVRPNGPVTLLLPPAGALYRRLFDGEAGAAAPSPRALLDLLLDHVVFGHVDLVPNRDDMLQAPFGRERSLTWQGDRALIEGVEIKQPGFALGRYWGYQLADVMPRRTSPGNGTGRGLVAAV